HAPPSFNTQVLNEKDGRIMKMFADRATELAAVARVYRAGRPGRRSSRLQRILANRLAERFNSRDVMKDEIHPADWNLDDRAARRVAME
ncbi:MAG TPA: hypothetical protein VGM59_12400, partial [Dongiaceae bacterium]